MLPGTCDSGDFTCDNGNCVAWYRECDGSDDCGDYSDEDHCYGTVGIKTIIFNKRNHAKYEFEFIWFLHSMKYKE